MEDDQKTPVQKAVTIGKASKQLALQLSELTGLPVNNAVKIASGMMNHYMDFVSRAYAEDVKRYGLPQFESGANIKTKQYKSRVFRDVLTDGVESENFESDLKKAMDRSGMDEKGLFGSDQRTYDGLYQVYIDYGRDSEEFEEYMKFLFRIGKEEKNIEKALKDRIKKRGDR